MLARLLFISVFFFAGQIFAQDVKELEKQVRAAPVYGTAILPSVEAGYEKEGFKKATGDDAFLVFLEDDRISVEIWFSKAETEEWGVIRIYGSYDREAGVSIDAITAMNEPRL